MKRMSKRFVQALVLLAGLGLSGAAWANPSWSWSGAWGAASHGMPSIDPHAAVVQVVPPQGGTVMLYRGSELVGWWMHPSFTTVRPGQLYGVVATRGTHLMHNAAMVFRPGITTISWDQGDVPLIVYQPAMRLPASRVAARSVRRSGAASHSDHGSAIDRRSDRQASRRSVDRPVARRVALKKPAAVSTPPRRAEAGPRPAAVRFKPAARVRHGQAPSPKSKAAADITTSTQPRAEAAPRPAAVRFRPVGRVRHEQPHSPKPKPAADSTTSTQPHHEAAPRPRRADFRVKPVARVRHERSHSPKPRAETSTE